MILCEIQLSYRMFIETISSAHSVSLALARSLFSLSHSTFHRFKSLCNVRFLLLSSASLLHIIYYNTGLFCASSNFRIFNSLIPPECSSFQRSVFLFAIVILMLMILRVFDKPNVWWQMAISNLKKVECCLFDFCTPNNSLLFSPIRDCIT